MAEDDSGELILSVYTTLSERGEEKRVPGFVTIPETMILSDHLVQTVEEGFFDTAIKAHERLRAKLSTFTAAKCSKPHHIRQAPYCFSCSRLCT